jgi:hypothetical protein
VRAMPEWTEGTLKEFKQFMGGNKEVKDPLERALRDISDSLARAWRNNRCLQCPIAELSALAAATLVFYLESKRR